MVRGVGCGEPLAGSGAGEPLYVDEGTFFLGDLPGDDAATTPFIANASAVGSVVTAGQSSIHVSGLASPEAWSVAVAFPELGEGYWVVPVAGPDPTQGNQLVFSMNLNISEIVPAGLQTLDYVALDGQGRPGPRYSTTLCVLPEVSNNNLAACDPATPPQGAVLSLTWDTQVDLDLVVVAPNGKIVRAKTPTTVLPEEGATSIPTTAVNDPTTGRLSRDSNGGCRIDGIRRESLVFPGDPPPGDYVIYANLASPCGRSNVRFQLREFVRTVADDGTWPIEETLLASGQLLALQADDGASLGLRVTTVTFPDTSVPEDPP